MKQKKKESRQQSLCNYGELERQSERHGSDISDGITPSFEQLADQGGRRSGRRRSRASEGRLRTG